MNPNHSIRSRIANSISFARRFWLLIVLLLLPLGLFVHSCWLTMRSDWFLTRADYLVVSVRRNLNDHTAANGWGYDYYKLTGIEKAEFVAQFRQRTLGLSSRTYAGIYPFWVYTLDANGICTGKILVQGTDDGRPEQFQAIYEAAVKGERVEKLPIRAKEWLGVLLVRQIKK